MAMKETVAIELITPIIAEALLRRNENNRSLRNHRVEQYARAMKSGEWLLTGDAIVLNDDGMLINGQHRLSAVSHAGVTIPFLVLRGADERVYGVMDAGSPRSTRDLFTHNGVTRYVGEKASTARAAFAYIAGKAPGVVISAGDVLLPSSAQLYQVYEEYKAEIDFASKDLYD